MLRWSGIRSLCDNRAGSFLLFSFIILSRLVVVGQQEAAAKHVHGMGAGVERRER